MNDDDLIKLIRAKGREVGGGANRYYLAANRLEYKNFVIDRLQVENDKQQTAFIELRTAFRNLLDVVADGWDLESRLKFVRQLRSKKCEKLSC